MTSEHRILVVDDDPDILNIITLVLEDEGYCIQQAANGLCALNLLRHGPTPPSLILLDRMMPVMDGIEFVRVKSSIVELASIPVILLSADADIETQVQQSALKEG